MTCLPPAAVLLTALSFLLLLDCSAPVAAGSLQCRDEDNNPIDWFFVYKLPLIHNSPHPELRSGKGYLYSTSANVNRQISKKTIDSNSTLLANTLSILNTEDPEIFWLNYNDQGNETCFDCGHTKGFLGGDESGGFWLVHSIPHFLSSSYPPTGLRYAQSALCISLNRESLNTVGELLVYNEPKFRFANLKNYVQSLYPSIWAALNHRKAVSPWTMQKTLTSIGGTEFRAFAKAGMFNRDLYEWVASSLETNLMTETWKNEKDVLPSSCNLKYKVMNIAEMIIPELKTNYPSTKDHSKMAFSFNKSNPYLCVGDINRAVSQEKRGGGTVCTGAPDLWSTASGLIGKVDKCSTSPLLSTSSPPSPPPPPQVILNPLEG